MNRQSWDDALEYVHRLGAHELERATDLLDAAIDRNGIGALGDAFSEVCVSLMDRVLFPPGTVDIHAVVDTIALRIIDTSHDAQPGALDRQRSLLVFLGSVGLPCAARDDVASWDPTDRLHDLIACTIGLLVAVAEDEGAEVADIVAAIEPPGPLRSPEGTFDLAWRGPNGAEPFAGAVPRGYTAHITFLGSEPCSLRAIFGRVAMLRGDTSATADAETLNVSVVNPEDAGD